MHPVAGATISVADLDEASLTYRRHLGYREVERGTVPRALATAWGVPKTADTRMALLEPDSGTPCFIRMVEAPPVPAYRPLRSYGWASLEIAVSGVDALGERLKASPFEIIGPPADVSFSTRIRPMQVNGPSGETLFLTMLKPLAPGEADTAPYDLHPAQGAVDRIFIMVFAASDIARTLGFYEAVFGWTVSKPMAIEYKVLAKSFDDPALRVEIATVTKGREVFLEIDQYPDGATVRPALPGHLPPGAAMTSFLVPSLDSLKAAFIAPPAIHDGRQYAGRRAATLRGPDSELIEVIEQP